MSVKLGTQWEYLTRARKSVTVTYPAVTETSLGSPGLPTTKPGTPQIDFTIAANKFPTFNHEPQNVMYILGVVVSGRNVSGSTDDVRWELYKNTSQITTGNLSLANNSYWTAQFTATALRDIAVDDNIQIYLYADLSGFDVREYSYWITPSRIQLEPDGTVLKGVSVTLSIYPTLTVGNPGQNTAQGTQMQSAGQAFSTAETASGSYGGLIDDATNGMCRVYYGDYGSTATQSVSHTSNHPRYWRNYRVTAITYTPLHVRCP